MAHKMPRLRLKSRSREGEAQADAAQAAGAASPGGAQQTPAGAEASPGGAQQTPAGAEASPGGAEQTPAGAEPPSSEPGFRQRGRMRRRLRYLRAARELSYRDLGGLMFDLHRFGGRRDELLAAKLARLGQLDGELRALEHALHDRQPVTVLRQAGVVACARCAAIHSSEDRFCPICGLPLARDAERPLATAPSAPHTRPPAAPQQHTGAPPFPPAQPPAPPMTVPGAAGSPRPTSSVPAGAAAGIPPAAPVPVPAAGASAPRTGPAPWRAPAAPPAPAAPGPAPSAAIPAPAAPPSVPTPPAAPAASPGAPPASAAPTAGAVPDRRAAEDTRVERPPAGDQPTQIMRRADEEPGGSADGGGRESR
jgi:hypothetical protein